MPLTITHNNADFYTINLDNNSGSNYSYSVRDEYITQSGATTWDNSSSWRAGEVPPAEADVIIAHDLDLTDEQTAFSVTIENGAALNNSSTLNIQDDGNITINNLSSSSILGEVVFNGNGLVSGEVVFNNVALDNSTTGVNFNTQSTINGTLTINAGGNVVTGSPIYGPSSTLIYDTGNTIINPYGRRSEWSNAGIQGAPYNVEIRTGTYLDLGFDDQRLDIPAEITGNLTIESGAGIFMDDSNSNNMESPLIVGGHFLNNGEIRLSQNTPNVDPMLNGDLRVFGDFTNNGTFIFNNRALFFEGANNQIITAANNFEIPFLVIDKSGGEVVLAQDIIVSGTGGPALNMFNQGKLNLNDHQLQIGNSSDTPISMTGNSHLVGSNDSRIVFNSTNSSANTLVFSQNTLNQENYLSEFEMEGSGTVGLSDTLNILRRFILKDGTFNSDTHLTFKSSDALTAIVPEVTGGSISGEVRVERYFPLSNRAYRYISSSVTTSPTSSKPTIHDNWQEGATSVLFDPNPGFGTHITGAQGQVGDVSTDGFDMTSTGKKSLYRFDEATQVFPPSGVSSTNNNTTDNITAGEPYALMIRGDRSATLNSNTAQGSNPAILRTTGAIVTGDQTVNSSISGSQFALIGNPYQARVDMSQLVTPMTNFNPNYMWIWDPSIGTLGGYAVVTLSNGNNTSTDFLTTLPTTSTANEFLQPFQACFLEATADNPSLTFLESAKSTSADNIGTFSDDNSSPLSTLDIELIRANDQLLVDAVRHVFDNGYNVSKTFEDATKLWNNQENIAIVDDNAYISINKRPLPQTETLIPFYTAGYQGSDYLFKIELNEIPTGTSVGLIDNYTNTTTALTDGLNTYNFDIDNSIPESTATDRFALIFHEGTLSSTSFTPPIDINIYPNPAADFITIELQDDLLSKNIQIECYDVLGRLQFEITLNPIEDELSLDISPLSSGYYVLKISTPTGHYTHKFIKE